LGVECPGCGAQRSFWSLIQGNVLESLLMFPALIPLLMLVIVAVIHLIRPFRQAPKWIIRLVTITGVLMVGNFIVKLIS
jgi:hypothetical protein